MRIVTVFKCGSWFGLVLNRCRRIVHETAGQGSEFRARELAGQWLLEQQGRAA